ncbi:MAG TPA: hypothetical protein VF148_14740 [Acidimicrobiia bacterium]
MKRKLIGLLVVVVVGALAVPALAITDGTPDGEGNSAEYPYVGQLLFYVPDAIDPRFGPEDPGAWFNCTGTLIDESVVLTAGHCTFAVGDGIDSTLTDPSNPSPLVDTDDDGESDNGAGGTDVWINFSQEPNYEGFPPSTDYFDNPDDTTGPDDNTNEDRFLDREDWLDGPDATDWIRGTAWPIPFYNDAAFLLFDLGVVVLNPMASETVPLGPYPELVELGALDKYEAPGSGRFKAKDRFTAVGYGLREIVPFFEPNYGAGENDQRYIADGLMVIDGTGVLGFGPTFPYDAALVFSNSPGKAHTGGTCFGDSGGPIFDADGDFAAVTSFGLNQNCKGTGGGYRLDQADDQDWLDQGLSGGGWDSHPDGDSPWQ